jgi:hypothetical protein
MPHLTCEYLGRKQRVALISEITVRSGRKIVGDSKGIGGGVELARVNLRNQGAQVWRVPTRAGNSLLVTEENSKKGFASTGKGGCHEKLVPYKVNIKRMVRREEATKQ